MPHVDTIYEAFKVDSAFSDSYTRAREDRADGIFEEILEIADNSTNDYMNKKNPDGTKGEEVLNSEHVQRSKLRIDSRKWMLGKMQPKKYGEKQVVDVEGGITITLPHGVDDL